MNTTRKWMLATGAVLSLTAASFHVAHAHDHAGMGMGGGGMGGMHGRHMDPAAMEKRHTQMLERLKSAINPTESQQAAWQQFVEASGKRHAGAPARPQGMRDVSAPDRFEMMAAMAAQRQAHMQGMAADLRQLYAALTPEQRAAADKAMAFGPRGRGGEHRHNHTPKSTPPVN